MSSLRVAYHARWVLPVSAAAFEHGAVVVDGDHIAFVGASTLAVADRHVQLGNAALLPGLVNAHTHLELTSLRGFLEGLDFRVWLRTLTDVRRELLAPEDLFDASVFGIHEGLLNGITTFADTAASLEPLAALRATGVRGIGYIETFGPDPAQCDAAMARLRESVAASRPFNSALVQTGISPHAPYTVSTTLCSAVARYAREAGLPVAVHIAESEAEVQFVRDGTGAFADRLRDRGIAVEGTHASPIALLDACGLLGARPLLIHAIHVDESDLARIADTGSRIVHCPVSNAKLGHGIAPLDRMLAHGIATGLGTDSVASNNRMDLLGEARQATLLQALRQRVPDALDAHTALMLATLGGARALGLDAEIGSLEPGKQADLAAFPLDRTEALPVFDPALTLVHALAGAVTATLVTVAGIERVRDGVVIGADPALRDRVRATGDRLKAWREVTLPGRRTVA